LGLEVEVEVEVEVDLEMDYLIGENFFLMV
jgi:hypothetical protein